MKKKRAVEAVTNNDDSTRSSLFTSTIYMLCSTMDEKCSKKLLLKQQERRQRHRPIQKTTTTNLAGESIVSTAESHLTSRLKHVTRRELAHPRANSSPCRGGPVLNQSMTFNVDYASTPKKNQPRASTPSRMNNQRPNTLLTSSVLRVKKTIPPPLLSSSMRPASSQPLRKRKRPAAECCCCCTNSRATAVSNNGTVEKLDSKKARRRVSVDNFSYKPKPTCQQQLNGLVGANSHLAKYPVRFMPDRRVQDIDRCDPIDDVLVSCDLRPFLTSCYAFGDYNVWIV